MRRNCAGSQKHLNEFPMDKDTLTKTGNERSRAERFSELDARISQNIAEIKAGFANLKKSDFPPDWIDKAGFEDFIKSRRITLREADEIALSVLCAYFDAGAVISPETILHCLTTFNPVRAKAVSA